MSSLKDEAERLQREAERTVTDEFVDDVHKAIGRRQAPSLVELADALDAPPKKIREAIAELQDRGFRVTASETDGGVTLQRLPPASRNRSKLMFEGDTITLGVISDTHLSSKEHAPDVLEAAYDAFVDRGITTVLHAGDLVAGRGIYATQDQDILHHTYQAQVENAVATYPRRDGITTKVIGGNHDLEGAFGRIGADPVQAVANRRPDIEALGAYTAAVELPNGAHITLVHGRGGGGYAISYKAQKWVEGLPAGRKPALVVFGHWHVSGMFRHRNVPVMLGGCFEWQTSLLVRLGLQPDVGFWVVDLTLGKDGSMLRIRPEWFSAYAGRK